MDTGNPLMAVELEEVNGIVDSTIENEGANGSVETVVELAGSGTLDCLEGRGGEGSGLIISKESSVADSNTMNHSEKGRGRNKTEKPSNPKNVATWVKKNKDGKHMEAVSAVSNGLGTSKQPFALATNRRSSNDRQIAEGITTVDSSSPTKVASALSTTRHSQQSENPFTASPAISTAVSEGLKEQAKHLKPLKQGPPAKVKENTQSASLSPTAGGTKIRRTGGLPSYGFGFKCDERAEKRKEFYSKLEEKIYAKEVERTTLQAKSKETQEAEIKMLRKSLTFRATPMPSFYHEPAPPRVELKKIPPTRAKSPKLGRHNSSPMADSEGNSSHSSRMGRLSLDEKVTRDGITKRSSSQHFKKPLRNSLPRLPSEKSTLANATEDAASQHPECDKMEQEAGQTSEPSQTQAHVDAEYVAEEQTQASLEQEPESEPNASEH